MGKSKEIAGAGEVEGRWSQLEGQASSPAFASATTMPVLTVYTVFFSNVQLMWN